ncbi:MAG: hypothetical protein ACRC5T_08060, partial [Cetobacterium sp.]
MIDKRIIDLIEEKVIIENDNLIFDGDLGTRKIKYSDFKNLVTNGSVLKNMIVNNFSGGTGKVLSAEMGFELKRLVDLADGIVGATGAQGIQGMQGEKGEKGDKGDLGGTYSLANDFLGGTNMALTGEKGKELNARVLNNVFDIKKTTIKNIADLKNVTGLKVDDIIYLQGVEVAGDGGHHLRKVVSNNDNNGETISGGLFADKVKYSSIKDEVENFWTDFTKLIGKNYKGNFKNGVEYEKGDVYYKEVSEVMKFSITNSSSPFFTLTKKEIILKDFKVLEEAEKDFDIYNHKKRGIVKLNLGVELQKIKDTDRINFST